MSEYEDDFDDDLDDDEELGDSLWISVGEAVNRTIADFAINGLKSYDIPAVLDNRPGVLGAAGLAMRSITDGALETYRILVPEEYADEAREVIKLFLGAPDEDEETEFEDEDENDWD